MKEYIEKATARDLMEQALADDWEIQYADDRLDEIPAADVVEVVRCKDCKYFQPFRKHDGFCSIDGMLLDNNHFCKCGERKGGGERWIS